jgi:surfeit locus 1 family protein
VRRLLLLLFLGAALGFPALGIWQVERRAWKHALIARVTERIHAPAVPLPPPGQGRNVANDEYLRVRATGRYRHDQAVLVETLTERGAGAWVMTPLATPAGIVLVNRGFLPEEEKDFSRPAGLVTVTGLLRFSEPEGRFLRPNRPQMGRWYSRDVAAIAAARHLGRVAPFFIDAEATPAARYPVGGMTVVQFRDAHLVYALTWFALAGLAAFGAWRLRRDP